MNPSNREIQQRKTCQIFAYVLHSLGKEVPYHIDECADSYEYPVNCVEELSQELQGLDTQTLNKIMNNPHIQESSDLKHWWEMFQEVEKLHKIKY